MLNNATVDKLINMNLKAMVSGNISRLSSARSACYDLSKPGTNRELKKSGKSADFANFPDYADTPVPMAEQPSG